MSTSDQRRCGEDVADPRVRGDAERARHALVDRLAAIDPNMAEVDTLEISRAWERIFWGFRSGRRWCLERWRCC